MGLEWRSLRETEPLTKPKDIIAVTKARSHFVSFRVTDEEYKQLKLACDQHGLPSVSAFARKVMLSRPDVAGENLNGEIAVLNDRISVLETTLARMTQALAAFKISGDSR